MATTPRKAGDAIQVLKAKKTHELSYHEFTKQEQVPLQDALLKWYNASKRDLPWRKPHGLSCKLKKNVPIGYPLDAQRAYEVWISEIMLQQTQVKTVIAYYNKWMQKWPTIFDLGAASLSEVNEVWAGLGYYSRARRIHEAACLTVEKLGGILPRTAEQLEKTIPGVGRYTAGAIASIAYEERAELVDGNVVRVLSRLRSIGADPKSKLATTLHWKLAKEILDPVHPGDFNQALMEHGATICLPQNPLCSRCPVQIWCKAYAEERAASDEKGMTRKLAMQDMEDYESNCAICGKSPETLSSYTVTRYPRKVARKTPRSTDTAVCVLERRPLQSEARREGPPSSEYLLIQRPAGGLLGGLWEFPSVTLPSNEVGDGANTAYDVRSTMLEEYIRTVIGRTVTSSRKAGANNTAVLSRRDCGSIPHVFSHIKQTLWVEHVTIAEDVNATIGSKTVSKAGPAYKWVLADALQSEAISTGMKKVFKVLTQPKSVLSDTKSTRQKAGTTDYPRKKRKL